MSSQVEEPPVAGNQSAVGLECGAGAGAKGSGRRRQVQSVHHSCTAWGIFSAEQFFLCMCLETNTL